MPHAEVNGQRIGLGDAGGHGAHVVGVTNPCSVDDAIGESLPDRVR
jgi:hypothetical protein